MGIALCGRPLVEHFLHGFRYHVLLWSDPAHSAIDSGQGSAALRNHAALDQFVHDLVGDDTDEFVAHLRISAQQFHGLLLSG
jgi:hypothetical protein